jgi:hypothetical protein
VGRGCFRAGCNFSVYPARYACGARLAYPPATFVFYVGYLTLFGPGRARLTTESSRHLSSHFVKTRGYEAEQNAF